MTSIGRSLSGTHGEIVAGLDLGTTKVCVVVGEITEDGIDIIGVGAVPSKGLRRGVVVNIDATVQAIRGAIEQAESMAGVEIRSVYAGISGSHIQGMNKEGVAAIANREVNQEDVRRVLEQARAIPLSSDRQVIHVLPQEYIVDNQGGIKEPIGMNGVRLQAHVHIVTAATASVQNIIKCADRSQLHVLEVVLEPLASAQAVLEEDEKEIGVALVDIGGGTSDLIVYLDGAVVHTSVIPIGGNNLTNDIAQCLRTPIAEAERLKIKHGCASPTMVDPEERIQVPSVGGRAPRTLTRQELCSIIEPRLEELFQAIGYTLEQAGFLNLLGGGVVITGGSTQLEGIAELAEQVLGLPVRKGVPTGVGGLVDVVRGPAYATGVGLVKYGAAKIRAEEVPTAAVETSPKPSTPQLSWAQRIGAWFREVF
ncbi:MAG: cell division protein FtsA [Sandaracinaceae bacterium]|nr:cell division protein FtsA [Sandaracinaceae bacterium]MDW8245551.1 cell division protein FtsA [Sandaracinaceae bacterium]